MIGKLFLQILLCAAVACSAQNLPNAPSAQKALVTKINTDTGWPRTLKNGTTEFVIYQPQVDKWDGNRVYLYSAVELKMGEKAPPQYGVVSYSARTEVDKVNRLVTLDSLDISAVKFPAAKEKDAAVLAALKTKFAAKTKTISLDRLESAVRASVLKFKGVEVKNDPPKIIIATKPAMLVIIDGPPKLVEVQTTNLQRVVNTNAVLLFENGKKKYYLRVMDWWLEALEVDGQWKRAEKLPDDMKKAEELIASKSQAQLPEAQPKVNAKATEPKQASLKDKDSEVEVPEVFVSFSPAELVTLKGDPEFETVPGTSLEFVKNSKTIILKQSGEYYILISGRWFKSNDLHGEWTYVDAKTMPAEFAKIPTDSPIASALVSIPGTPQAEEALIANSIPQTATITRSQAKLTVMYDGTEAIFVPIEGTTLSYARNTSAPVIKVADGKYYSVESGVWFKAPSPQGPWGVADSVPDVIYTIPASSPLHYVTYAKVYGATPEVVYVGYTPGYYGTVTSASTMTVVYGTGWYYPPYIGSTAWYGYPYTYGVGAGFTWTNDSGWSFGFGFTYYPYYYPYYPWWGPMGYYGCCWYPYYGWGAWGGAAAANVYGRWGNTAYSRTAAAWANPYTGNYGAASRGATYNTATGRVTAGGRGYNTNIYTGNTAGYRGAATYNPNTGIVAGAGAGYAGNVYSGTGTAGRGGFAYNTNTDAGVAVGKNNVYAGKDGTVYRYDRSSGAWSQNSGNGWQSAERSGGNPSVTPSLERQQQARAQGAQRSQNFNSMRNSPSMNRSYSRPSMGMRGGGRRR